MREFSQIFRRDDHQGSRHPRIINNVDAQSCNRAFDSGSLLYSLKFSNLLHLDDTESNDPNKGTHIEDLKRAPSRIWIRD